MGVKVSSVIDKKSGNKVTVKDCEKGYDGEYICKTNGCCANMSFVRFHEQRRHNKTIKIPSFFKLKPGEKHSYQVCPFNTQGAVEVIARESDSNILKAISDKKYEFSLQVLHKDDKRNKVRAISEDNSDIYTSKERRGKKITGRGMASSYIKALKQILTLRAQLEDNKELIPLIELKYQQSKIKWSDFYFGLNDYARAYEIARNAKNQYPMCFHGVISKTTLPNDKFRYSKLKLLSPYVELKTNINPIPSIEFIISDESYDVSLIPAGSEVLVYSIVNTTTGDWTPPGQKVLEKPKILRFLNMQGWINHTEQIAKL